MVIFEERIGKTETETKWKIQDVEKLLQSRISEQKVNDSIKRLEREFKNELALLRTTYDSKIETVDEGNQKLLHDHRHMFDLGLKSMRHDVDHVLRDINTVVQKEEYQQTVMRLDNTKKYLEEEMDLIQTQIKQQKDK